MKDSFGREIDYLRISVTQRCDLNCLYCGAEKPDTNEMTVAEIVSAARAFADCGINKVRLTGGEPLMRSDITDIAGGIARIEGIKKLVLTTNGVQLAKYAASLKKAGVSAVNVSLDTLDREEYKRMTGRDCLPQVLEGLRAAENAGLKVRVNAVLIRGENDSGAERLIGLAKDSHTDVRFIELMPFADAGKNEKLIVKGAEILEKFAFLHPVKQKNAGQSVAKYYEADGYLGQIGLITPVSDKFCGECNRIRLLSDGKIKPCLGQETVYDLRPFFGSEEEMRRIIREAIYAKPVGHNFGCAYGNSHAMNKIGG